MTYAQYYKTKLESGLLYQDFVVDAAWQLLGLAIVQRRHPSEKVHTFHLEFIVMTTAGFMLLVIMTLYSFSPNDYFSNSISLVGKNIKLLKTVQKRLRDFCSEIRTQGNTLL